MKTKNNRGFTLIELLIVIAIIGILAGTILLSLNSARSKANNARVQSGVAQVRTELEQSYANNYYIDIQSSAAHTGDLVATSSGNANLSTLLCDIAQQNNFTSTVPDDVSLTCNGVTQHSGVVIYSNDTGWTVRDYAIYATTTPGGYVCLDSFGHTQTSPTGSIPDFASITAPASALCQ